MRRDATVEVLADGTLEGKLHISFDGQEALTRRLDLYDEDEAGRKNALEAEIKGWMPDNAKIEVTSSSGWTSSKEKLEVDCQFSVPEFATKVGRRLLVPLAAFSKQANPFKSNKRTLPIYFPYSHRTEDQISLSLPEGFRLEGVPAPHSEIYFDSPYKTAVTRTKDGVDFQRTFDLNGFIFDKYSFVDLKRFFSLVFAADSEQMVLQQADAAQP
jgi:hypothetical protein